jgi:hypothetical protein
LKPDVKASRSFLERIKTPKAILSSLTAAVISSSLLLNSDQDFIANAAMRIPIQASTAKLTREVFKDFQDAESPALKLARQKRTAAIKAFEGKGIIKVETDDIGNQYLKLPWFPDQKLLYKSMPLQSKLWSELCAGALGEISKDVLLHAVDTAKTRRQAKTATSTSPSDQAGINSPSFNVSAAIVSIKDLYSGFPVVLVSSIPQGGAFFLVKKGSIEVLTNSFPTIPSFLSSTIPIGLGVMMYWLFRTPAEVIKTQVQTKQYPDVRRAIETAKATYPNGYLGLWKYYSVMLSLDIPFQIINFILYATISDAVTHAGYPTSVWTRLFCGVTCGMISAGLTCPLDVCKTRIISRDKAQMAAMTAKKTADQESTSNSATSMIDLMEINSDSSAKVATDRSLQLEDTDIILVDGNKQACENVGSLTLSADMSDLDSLTVDGHDRIEPVITSNEHQIVTGQTSPVTSNATIPSNNKNMLVEIVTTFQQEGPKTLFLGLGQRLLYVGLANGIRLAAYGTSRMDLMLRSLDSL